MTQGQKSWRCLVCGYIHVGEQPPESCPVCGAGIDAFEAVPDKGGASESAEAEVLRWKCKVCGYVEEGVEPPKSCPVCGAPADAFHKAGETTAPPKPKTSWRCGVCGYVHEGVDPPEICLQCHADVSVFERRRSDGSLTWVRVAEREELPEGRVKTVTARERSFALTHVDGTFSLLTNRCPHQGGPLGEGTIEEGKLRCPWHGWDFDPKTGKVPGTDYGVDAHPCEVRGDGIYVGLEADEGPARRTISDVMVETMIQWGVTHVFGMVGHSNLGFADAMRRQVERGKLDYIGIRHEGAAAFAASAYGKLTGRPAACFSIAGPGATNLLTGLWDAKMDRVPLLALTGQVDTQVLGPGAFQEADLSAAFRPVATWSQTVLPESRPAELMTLALKHAIVERGVGHLVLPNEVQGIVDEETPKGGPRGRMTPPDIQPPLDAMERALDLVENSKRPVIIVGHGARFHMRPILQLAEALRCPIITTFKGKGLVSDDHPLACGVLGRSGTPIASHFMNESDALLVFGASFSNHTGIRPDRPTIQVDYDPMALGRFHPVDVPLLGEIGVTARMLREYLGNSGDVSWEDRREAIAAKWAWWRREKQSRAADDRGRGINSAALFDALSRVTPAKAVIAVDVGNNTYSFGRYFECREQAVLMSGYLGSIGFGYPAAMGAWAAAPDRPIVAVTGDGGFAQYMGELTTAVARGMNITHVLLNNGELGKITKEQRAARLKVWQTKLHNPSFADYAELCGALGLRVTSKDGLLGAFEKAFDHDGPALVEVMTDSALV